MAWSPQEIRDLRLRLGWSAAEFGRRLGASAKLVQEWELGKNVLDPETVNQLCQLRSQVERHADRIWQEPIAEAVMNREALAQINNDYIQRFTT